MKISFIHNERVLFGIMLAEFISLIVVVFISAYLLRTQNIAQEKFKETNRLRYDSYLLADQLRQSSDDLTRMVRTYVSTGDENFEKYFWQILAIRNGEKARPEHYNRIYWDFMTVDPPQPPSMDGEEVALEELMKKAGFTEEEFLLLADAKNKSDKLVTIEKIAMNAMKGRFQDADGEFSVEGVPDPVLARSLVFGPEYHETKKEIMEPVNQFYKSIDHRTIHMVTQTSMLVRFYQWALTCAFYAFVINALILFFTAWKHQQLLVSRLKDAVEEKSMELVERKLAEREKIKLEKQLRQAQKMEAIGTLAGGIAHDFNNILSIINGYTELAKEEVPEGSSVREKLDRVLYGGNRAKDLVQQILAFSRQKQAERFPVELTPIVKESIKMLRPTLPTNIEINKYIQQDCGLVLADPTGINQIIMNLCTNAYHAMEDTGGKLDISLKEKILSAEDLVSEPNIKPGTFIHLSVADSGLGIPPEIRDKIFDPYFTTKKTGKGTGLGLSIVLGIVKSYGGFISLYSELGQGTVFHVFLPILKEEKVSTIRDDEDIQGGHERVLFIDDEVVLAEMGRDMLESLGYEVTIRNNSLEALETFRNQPAQFDLVITDQTMPGMTGAELSARLLNIRPDIPIILCSGYSSVISEEKAISMGIRKFACKPLTKKDLARLTRMVLDQ